MDEKGGNVKEMLKVVDFHLHPLPRIVSIEMILKEIKKANVVLAVLLGLDVDPKNILKRKIKKLIIKQTQEVFVWNYEEIYSQMKEILTLGKTSNEYVAEIVSSYPRRFVGIGSIDINKGGRYIKNKLQEIVKLDLKGVKILPTLQFFNPEGNRNLKKLFNLLNKESLILMIHCGCDPGPWEMEEFCRVGNPKLFEPLIKKSHNPVVLAHSGSYSAQEPKSDLKEALEIAEQYENVWLDLSAVTYLVEEEEVVEEFRNRNLMDRLLFGSDYPVFKLGIKETVEIIERSPVLSQSEKRDVLFENAKKLLEKI